jgi:hypothetical protein
MANTECKVNGCTLPPVYPWRRHCHSHEQEEKRRRRGEYFGIVIFIVGIAIVGGMFQLFGVIDKDDQPSPAPGTCESAYQTYRSYNAGQPHEKSRSDYIAMCEQTNSDLARIYGK